MAVGTPQSLRHKRVGVLGTLNKKVFQSAYADFVFLQPRIYSPGTVIFVRVPYWVFAPEKTPLPSLVTVAGTRWTIETNFETAKSEVGLDEYEVRSWHGWHRHMTLCLLAQGLLCVLRSVSLEAQGKGGTTIPRNSLRTFKYSRGLLCR